MPPKTTGMPKPAKAKPKRKGVLKNPGPAVPPASTQDPTNKKGLAYNIKDKEQIINLNKKLEDRKKEHDIQVKETKGTIKFLKKDNERLIRKQNMNFGATLDVVEEIKSSLISVKATNVKLYREMGETKEMHDNIEAELKAVKLKFSDTMTLISKFKKDSKEWVATREKLLKSEARCHNLLQTNKRLKDLLLKHHIDPNADVHEMMREDQQQYDRDSIRSDKTFPREPKAKKKMMVKGRYGSTDDLAMLVKPVKDKYDFQEGYGFLNNALFQMSPAYLGFYKRGRKNKDTKEDISLYRPGVILPRIVVSNGKRPAKFF